MCVQSDIQNAACSTNCSKHEDAKRQLHEQILKLNHQILDSFALEMTEMRNWLSKYLETSFLSTDWYLIGAALLNFAFVSALWMDTEWNA